MSMSRLAFLTALLLAPQLASAQDCLIVRLKSDFTAGDIKGGAPADDLLCYDLRFEQGQNLSIELINGTNVSVTVPGYYDDRPGRMYLGDLPGQLEVRVFQLMRSATPQPFVLRIRGEAPGNG